MYREILKGNILDPASVEVLKEDEKNYFEEIYLCQGLMKIKQYDYGDAYGHGGIYHGMAARCIYFPDSDINVGFFTNLGEQFPSENTRMFASTMNELVDVTFTGSRD
jgi:hypothetical protein